MQYYKITITTKNNGTNNNNIITCQDDGIDFIVIL